MTEIQSEELARTLARGDAASVIESLLNNDDNDNRVAEDRVYIVMESLGAMAVYRVDAACQLMLSLWPTASDLMMHDVCDAIGLWIWHNRTPAVIEYLKAVAAAEVDPDLKRHWMGMLP